jgi:hypothetical protein
MSLAQSGNPHPDFVFSVVMTVVVVVVVVVVGVFVDVVV